MLKTGKQPPSIETREIMKLTITGRSVQADDLAVEEPLEISLEYRTEGRLVRQVVAVTMRTPGNDEELALGFLFTEGIIRRLEEVEQVFMVEDNRVSIRLTGGAIPSIGKLDRNFYTTSSCGVCGKSSLDAIKAVSIYGVLSDLTVDRSILYKLAVKPQAHQSIFRRTGGLHASSLFDLDGNIRCIMEDVGRHNALDKVIGSLFTNGRLPQQQSILLLSGRASFELVQKASMAGIPVVAAIGAPSSLAAQLAQEVGITLVGFLREGAMNVYSRMERIL